MGVARQSRSVFSDSRVVVTSPEAVGSLGNEISNSPSTPIDVFFSYSHRDEAIRDELAKHLRLLERQGVIRTWHDRTIGAGDDWRNAIDDHLVNAKIVLLLVSADFLASDSATTSR